MTTVKPRSIPCKFDVVLSGAGISVDPPSALPTPWDLMVAVWNGIRRADPTLVTDGDSVDVLARLKERDFAVRMEQFLDALSGRPAIPLSVIVEVYNMVQSRAWNENHLRLAALDVEQFTVNMDKLIEYAGETTLVNHLHGAWDRPRTIKTTVSTYADGLPSATRRRFGKAIRDKHLLVIGYSGRDIDVMPIIDRYQPATITWVAPNADSLEVEADNLRQQRGNDFRPVPVKAGDYLPDLVPYVPKPGPPAAAASHLNMADVIAQRTTPQQRRLGVASLLTTIGINDLAIRTLNGSTFRGLAEARRRKLIARARARTGHPTEALAELMGHTDRLLPQLTNLTNLSDIAAIARRANRPDVERRARRMTLILAPIPSARRWRLLDQVNRGKRLAVDGDLDRAIDMVSRVTQRENAIKIIRPPGLVDALTWHADALKTRGDLREAREIANRAVQLAPNGDESQHAYALWKHAEISAIAGPGSADPTQDDLQLRDRFKKSIRFATRSGSHDTLAWFHGTYAEYLARADITAATEQIRLADQEGAGDPERPGHGRAYFLLQSAIIEAAAGRIDHARMLANEATQAATDFPNPAVVLQARQFHLYLRHIDGERQELRGDLIELAADFSTQKMRLAECRALAAATAAIGDPIDRALIDEANNKGWDLKDLDSRMSNVAQRYGFYLLL